jgi:poly(A) polymerase
MFINCTNKELFIFNKIAAAAKELGYPAYIVGGFVRDKIIDRPSKDADIVCVGDGIALAHKVAERFSPQPKVAFFKTFGTAQIKLADFEVEFVGARKESYDADSRKPAVSEGSLQDDQLRRDFTINALAISLNETDYGELVDPFDGIRDIALKRIVTPQNPATTFSDDPLRMMRAIRFAAQLQFNIDPATFAAIEQQKERIKIISQERITDEFNKIMLAKKPSIGLDLLYRSGLLQIIFPEMVALAGAEYKEGRGHKDNFYHTLEVIDNICKHTKDLWLRWAALLHDIGKPPTKRFEEGHGWTFHGHEVVGGKMVPKIFNRFKLPTHEPLRFVRKLVELHLRPISLTKENITDAAIRRLLFDAGEDFDALMLLCSADITSKNANKVKRFLENYDLVRAKCAEVEAKDHLRNWQPPIDGLQIMEAFGIGAGREVGIIKTAIREAILDGQIDNNVEAAFGLMVEEGKKLNLTLVNKSFHN